MVQGLNWNNYSATQIVEMNKNGIEVPKEVLEKAEAALSEQDAQEVTAEHGDVSQLKYSIVDTASSKNEAAELRNQLESEGMKLKDMVNMFTEQSNQASATLIESMKQIDEYVSYIEVEEENAQQLTDAAEDTQKVIIDIAKETEADINAMSAELESLNAEIEAGTATEAQIVQAEDLSAEIQETSADGSEKIKVKAADAEAISSQVASVDSNLKEIAQNVGKAYNKAIDGQELAHETMDMSRELYKKGKTIQTMAMALGGAAGLVGGAFAGNAAGGAIADSINDKKFNQFVQQNDLQVSHNYFGEVGYENSKGEFFSKSEINQEINAEKRSKNWDIGGTIGGAALGGGIGVGLGSLFGRSKIEAGQNGMNAAAKLTAVATQTKGIAENVAEQNGITIKSANAAKSASVEAKTLAAANANIDGETPEVSKPQDETPAIPQGQTLSTPDGTEVDPNKVKKQ